MITKINSIFSSQKFEELSAKAVSDNPWLTHASINYAAEAIKKQFLNENIVKQFCAKHKVNQQHKGRTVGIMCAGNLPLVGFGDMFYSLISGYNVLLKTSSRDPLMTAFATLESVSLAHNIEELHSADIILSMGSDATGRILEDKFPKIPLLLRGSMHSIAIISGEENAEQLTALADDMFLHCSRGCRSVTHLYVPQGYDFEALTNTLAQTKFSSPNYLPRPWYECYVSQKALLGLTNQEFIDGGFYILTQKRTDLASVFNYSYYSNQSDIELSGVQHIATADNFGTAQSPTIEDFANGIDIIAHLAVSGD